jgi:O-antigen ligase
VWLGIFFIGLIAVVIFALRDSIWWTMAACYVYFAIPIVEFKAPGAPYQAGFFGLGMLFAFLYYWKFPKWSEEEIYDVGLKVAREAIEKTREPAGEAMVTAVLQDRMPGEIRGAMSEASEPKAVEHVDAHCPQPIAVVVRRAVQSTLNQAIFDAEAEVVKILDRVDVRTKGNLRVILEQRALPVLNEGLDKKLDDQVRENIRELLEIDKKENPDRPTSLGPLDFPIPRGAIGGVLVNIGIWAHVAFTLMTYVFGKNALYDKQLALSKVATCILLFIPLIGIVTAVRTVRHFWMVALAWMFGTWHICMNGVSWWLQYGGRADNAGGQGGESNFLAGIICMVAPIAFGLALNAKEKWHRILALGVAGMYALGVLASGSRAGLLALVGGMGYWMMETNRRFLAVGLIMFAAMGFGIAAPKSFWKKMATIVEPSGANPWVRHMVEPSKHERQVLWALGLKIWKEHPITGIGPLNYVRVSAEETDFTDAYKGQRGLQAHNTWVQLLSEYGLAGAFVWGGMYFFSIFCYRRARKKMAPYQGYEWFGALCLGFEAGALAHAVTLVFNSFQWYDYIYWHFVFGPVALEVATHTVAKLEWLKPGDFVEARPPPRYGPPKSDGLDLDRIDLIEVSPLEAGSRTG